MTFKMACEKSPRRKKEILYHPLHSKEALSTRPSTQKIALLDITSDGSTDIHEEFLIASDRLTKSTLKFKDALTAIRVFRAMKMPHLCANVIELMKDTKQGLLPDFYTETIEGFADVGQWRKVSSLIGDMQQTRTPINNHTYNIIIACCVQRTALEVALSVLHQLKNKSKDGALTVDVKTYDQALAIGLDIGLPKVAIAYVEAMDKYKVTFSDETYGLAISALCVFPNHIPRALALLEQMREKGVVVPLRVYEAVVVGCERAGEWDKALKLFQDAKQLKVHGEDFHLSVYDSVISIHSSKGEWSKSIDLFHKMLIAGRKTKYKCKMSFMNTLTACVREGQWTVAVSLLGKMRYTCLKADSIVYNSMIDALGAVHSNTVDARGVHDADGRDKVEWILNEMNDNAIKRSTHTYNIAMKVLGRLGAWKRAMSLFRELKQEHETNGVSTEFFSYNTIVEALGICGQEAHIDNVYESMIEKFYSTQWDGFKENASKTVDLHYHSVFLAKSAVRCVFRRLLQSCYDQNIHISQSKKGVSNANNSFSQLSSFKSVDPTWMKTPLILIVGKGSNSGDEGPKLRFAVQTQLLTEMTPPINCVQHPTHFREGTLVPDSNDVRMWLEYQLHMENGA
eukprot:CFRG3940T1